MIDVTKLPKWAQEHIAHLERQRDEAIEKRNEVLGGVIEGSPFYIRDSVRQTNRPLSPFEDVVYVFEDGTEMAVDMQDGDVLLRAGGRGIGTLVVQPVASNCVRVRPAGLAR